MVRVALWHCVLLRGGRAGTSVLCGCFLLPSASFFLVPVEFEAVLTFDMQVQLAFGFTEEDVGVVFFPTQMIW